MRSWLELKIIQSDESGGFDGTVITEGKARLSGQYWSNVYLSEYLVALLSKVVRKKLPYLKKFHYPHKIYNLDVD